MAVPLESVVKQLTDSGIIAAGKLENFVPPKATPKDGEELLRELHKQNLLTKFQAQQVAAGRTKSLVLGAYTILDRIGAGGMGQVFKAEHRRMKRLVAIKTLPANTMKDAAAIARFQREVEAAAKLRHPNIVAADDAAEANGVHFLVMEYVEGQDLSVLVKKNGPLPVEKSVNFILQAARGLEFAHGEGVVHRDIKPANLLLDKKGVVKILDMGLARIESEGHVAAHAELTGSGAIMGTVDYMAPEQALSTKHADAKADIYSMGCSLYYLLTGKPIYDGETIMGRMLAHRESPIPSLRDVQDDVTDEIEAVFKKMVAKNVEDRYQSMSEVIAGLERCSSGSQTSLAIQQSESTNIENSALTFLRDMPAQTTQRTKPTKKVVAATSDEGKQPSWKNPKALISAGLVGVLILAAIIVVSLRTDDGTLIVEVDQPDVTVQVLDLEGKVEVSQKGGVGKVTVGVDPGKHRLRVEKEGFEVFAREFEIVAKGNLAMRAKLQPVQEIPEQVNQPWNTPAFQGWMEQIRAMPAEDQAKMVTQKLLEKNSGLNPKDIAIEIVDNVVAAVRCSSTKLIDISPIRALTDLKRVHVTGIVGRVGKATELSDLSPLRGMQLTDLWCGDSNVADLSPIKGMPLRQLRIAGTEISDLTPLQGMPLTGIVADRSKITDLSSLHTCTTLQTITLNGTPVPASEVAALQKALPKCKISWDDSSKATATVPAAAPAKPITDFNSPEFQAWMKEVQTMPAEEQIEAVSKKLMELNPGFDGKLTGNLGKGTPKINDNMVTELDLDTKNVINLSPLRALRGLKRLTCSGFSSKLSDLSPLQGLQLTHLGCRYTAITDLSPLKTMPLDGLDFQGTPLADLSPLHDLPLTHLNCASTKVADLSPLRGSNIVNLYCSGNPISDLTPLQECKNLKYLMVTRTKVTPAAVAALQNALHNCKIEWDDPAKATTPQPPPSVTK